MAKHLNVTEALSWVGAFDPDLRVFDIVMETEFGTTYNAYVLKGSAKTAVFETVKAKFFDEYLENLKTVIDPTEIDYIIVNHTEPDHAGSVARLLELAPLATVVGTTQAIKYMSEIINAPFKSLVVKDGETLSLGDKTIRFIGAPCLHWPDSMYSYIEEDRTLVTCDSFGAHYSDERVFKAELEEEKEDDYIKAYKYYYDMIMGPFKPFVLKALAKIEDLEIDFICPGHGMILDRTNMTKYINFYKEWSKPVVRSTPSIVIAYVSAYGYTEKLAKEIHEGILSTNPNCDVLLYDLVTADFDEVLAEASMAKGLLIGSPTILADTLPPIWKLLTSLNPVIHKGISAGCFGSYGWSGEATKNIAARFAQLKFPMPVEPLNIAFNPSESNLKEAFDFGVNFVQAIL
ncbi:FprA family A-type flavoprotein [Niameybacter massiliensis]|uniref:FprA family A-type flavoprotein n=1 Tax=Holtiella tumoricola TaxID=3018743 RepID=A0AA42IZP7_9FIRM|nr:MULTISPECIES: FprA family A-type flavoprotein [Lachnospirales]MDA3730579.1 FprA family A-type flavoprotein [Holtiella tumoricola]